MAQKVNIPKGIKEQCWLQQFGKVFEHKCYIPWCKNIITVFDYDVRHDKNNGISNSLDLNNIKPICSRCNHSMDDNYTIEEWVQLSRQTEKQCKPCSIC